MSLAYFLMKNMKKQLLSAFLMISSLLLSSSSMAHNVWLEPTTENSYVMEFGHEETMGYAKEKLIDVRAIDNQGQVIDVKKQYNDDVQKFFFTLDPSTSLVFLQFNNGTWSTLPNGRTVEKTRQEAPDATTTTNYMKYGKALLRWDEQATKQHDVKYELIPQGSPRAGESLAILVLVDGKPMEGIKVGAAEDDVMPTNSQGLVMYAVQEGTNKVWAEFEEKVDNANQSFDTRMVEYVLTFEGK